jgi:XTP/dITP diphosphohydrolase
LFVPDGHTRTMAELGPETKNKISHRAKAAAKLAPLLRQLRTP